MDYETIKVDANHENMLTITLDRLEANNSLNDILVYEMLEVIEGADDEIKIIIIQGQNGIFCTGMDFQLFTSNVASFDQQKAVDFSATYMKLLTTLATTNKIIVAKIDGKVLAGGVGLVAAADLVYASPKSNFSLSEALWGLLPANVLPYLIRRVGFQTAYKMTITTDIINATAAFQCHLVDEVLEDIDMHLSAKLSKILRLQTETILDLKSYFNDINPISEEVRALAINGLANLISKPRVQANVHNFVTQGIFPWN